jgi:hypothetical protein
LVGDLPDAHPFYHPDLLEFLAAHESIECELLVYEERADRVILPWLLRPLPAPVEEACEGRFRFDAFGPDYAGPLTASGSDDGVLERFLSALREHAAGRGILTAFLRLNPFADCQAALHGLAGSVLDRDVIWVDLSQGFDETWKGFRHAARKNYQRAVASGLEVRALEGDAEVDALTAVYEATMERREADARYRFDLAYFKRLLAAARGRSLIVTARKGGEVAASTLYLFGGGFAFSYLGGAFPEFSQHRPTNGVVTEAIRSLAGHGVSRLVLGGGYKPGDGIERFKRTFSPLSVPFRTFRLVFDRAAHDAACSKLGLEPAEDQGFFPAYRAPA